MGPVGRNEIAIAVLEVDDVHFLAFALATFALLVFTVVVVLGAFIVEAFPGSLCIGLVVLRVLMLAVFARF